jgi:DNA (cytosine-5)-methyltransferase 1
MVMEKPRLLDLFCGAGGAAAGYARAGFDVVGVDIRPQPNFPFPFIQADAIEYGKIHAAEFDAIHASPPCQAFTRGQKLRRGKSSSKPDLIAPTRKILMASGRPWVMENVVGAPLENPIILCGSMFSLAVRRHRLFESSHVLMLPGPCRHREQGRPVGVYHVMNDQVKGRDHATGKLVLGGKTAETLEEGRAAMGITWMTWVELRESIPPAYTEWLGRQIIKIIQRDL